MKSVAKPVVETVGRVLGVPSLGPPSLGFPSGQPYGSSSSHFSNLFGGALNRVGGHLLNRGGSFLGDQIFGSAERKTNVKDFESMLGAWKGAFPSATDQEFLGAGGGSSFGNSGGGAVGQGIAKAQLAQQRYQSDLQAQTARDVANIQRQSARDVATIQTDPAQKRLPHEISKLKSEVGQISQAIHESMMRMGKLKFETDTAQSQSQLEHQRAILAKELAEAGLTAEQTRNLFATFANTDSVARRTWSTPISILKAFSAWLTQQVSPKRHPPGANSFGKP